MKKQLLLAILMSISSLMTLMGQSAKKSLNYQAVILDPKAIDIPGAGISGQPLSKGKVCLKFTFLNALGNVDYEETQQTTTDEYGLISLSVGTGSYSNGTYKNFESIIWDANVKSMKVAVSYDGCATFKQVSTQALNYTAYALYAEAVDYKNVRDSPTKLSQFSNDIGYLVPKDLDPIKADIKTNTADIKSNTSQIALANQTIADNKKSSEDAFLIVNQSIKSIDIKVADNTTAIKDNTSSIGTINAKLNDQQNQISDNRNQIAATNNNLNNQIGGLQGQINTTNSTVSNLTGAAEVVSNKSTLVNLGGANPSDQLYPSQKAAKSYIDNAINDAVGSGVPDATTLAPGKVQLSGDLAGTATNPTVPALANKANLASPTFTGTPTAPTQTTGDNSTKLATTAFVTNSLAASAGGVPYTGATGAVNLGAYDLTVNGITVGTGGGNVSTNTALGTAALPANTTGNNNTAIGNNTLPVNTTGTYSTANGAYALRRNTTGEYNTANGAYALDRNTTGKQNTAIGAGAGVEIGFGTISNTTAIGYMATVSASNTIQLGNTAVTTIGGQVAWTAASDRRIKKNIVNSNYGLATVLKLRPVEYNLTSNDLKQVGFIAQEVQKLVPEVVTGKEGDLSKGEILGITYSNLVPVLTKAIQEQQKQIEEQNSKIAAQQKQIEELIKLVKGQ
jgi:predicted  nucleic acid-binding Zn-ribbon protein